MFREFLKRRRDKHLAYALRDTRSPAEIAYEDAEYHKQSETLKAAVDVPYYMRDEFLAQPMLWEEGGRVHNWKNYVGEHVRNIWHTFTDEQKISIGLDADTIADLEEWEW